MKAPTMKTNRGLWASLEALPTHEAVLVDWRRELGSELDAARRFLRPAQAPARSYPCTHRPPCECQHRIIDDDPRHILAVCHCDPPDCPPIRLTPQDRLVLALDTRKLCGAICAALRFQPASPGQFPGAARSLRLGTHGPAQSPAILSFPTEEGHILAEVGGLCAVIPDPFILLTPTDRHHTPAVEAALRRQGCLHIPLARFVSLAGPGKLTASPAVKPILATFDRQVQAGLPLRSGERAVRRPRCQSAPALP
jgi:hypothetical protein